MNADTQKRPGVLYAATIEGAELPIIDVTHPAFTVDDSAEAVDALRHSYAASEGQWRPHLVNRVLMRLFARKSLLLRGLVEPGAPFLSGLNTYVMKLGEENLVSPFDSDLDRKIAASPPARALRVRLQQTARLLADALEPELAQAPDKSLDLVNIGGGPAIDSINALLLLKQRSAGILRQRIAIHIFDLDSSGPAFGQRALDRLMASGAPLEGTNIQLRHVLYNWKDAAPLCALMQRLQKEDEIVAVSSEGALFEYGNDEAVIANLEALHCDGALKAVVGSVTRADDLTKKMHSQGTIRLVHRGLDCFAQLARQAGFEIVRSEPALTSDQVLMRSGMPG